MRKPKVLCVLSNILGNKTFTSRLVQVLNDIDIIRPVYLFYDPEDYGRFPIPRLANISATYASSCRIRNKYRDRINESFDILLFQSYSLVPQFYKLIKELPTVVALDTTPTLAHQLIAQESTSRVRKVISKLSAHTWKIMFRKLFRDVDMFLPWSSWCSNSLKSDFCISPEKVYVTYCPVDLCAWKPLGRKKSNRRAVLLFVGNDFRRKGGEFLLSLYQRYLSADCILRIVSNDKWLWGQDLGAGIELYQGITQDNPGRLIEIYQSSDIFVFPSRRDQLGLVLGEAMASGLPIIATDVGAVGELVRDNVNGFLMPYKGDLEEWAVKIRDLMNNQHGLERLGRNSRILAESMLSMEEFRDKIVRVMEDLRNTANMNCGENKWIRLGVKRPDSIKQV